MRRLANKNVVLHKNKTRHFTMLGVANFELHKQIAVLTYDMTVVFPVPGIW